MQLKQKLVRRVRAQFGRPTGLPGRMAGRVMAHRSSNRRRNAWVVSLLDVQRDDRVLEIGFGPGVAIRELARLAADGHVYGLDHSEVMVRQAARRNAEGVRRGQVELRLGTVERLPAFDVPFDKILAVNVNVFWLKPARELEQKLVEVQQNLLELRTTGRHDPCVGIRATLLDRGRVETCDHLLRCATSSTTALSFRSSRTPHISSTTRWRRCRAGRRTDCSSTRERGTRVACGHGRRAGGRCR